MDAPTTSDIAEPLAAKKKHGFGVRSLASLVVFIIAVVLTPVALIGHWGHRTIADTEHYLTTVQPLASDPVIQNAVADTLTESIMAKANVEVAIGDLITNLLPNVPKASELAAPITSGIESLLREAILRFMQTEQFQTLWTELNRTASEGIVKLLEGEPSGPIQLQGDEVVLDISTLLVAVQNQLVANGFDIAANVTIPDGDRQIVLLNAPGLAQIRTIYAFANPILTWIIPIVAVIFLISIALARRRAMVVVATGVALAVWSVVLGVALRLGDSALTDLLNNSSVYKITSAFWASLSDYLNQGVWVFLIYGIVIALMGWFAGRTASAQRSRSFVVDTLNGVGGRLPAGPASAVGDFVHRHIVVIRIVILILAAIFMLVGNVMTVPRLIWTLIFTVVALLIAEVLAGARTSSVVETGTNLEEVSNSR